MNKEDELKTRIITFINQMNSALDNNKKIYNTIIEPKFDKIKFLFMRNKISEKELTNKKESYNELVSNIDKIKQFNEKILKSLENDVLTIQYLYLLDSEFQSMSHYFQSRNHINYINEHFEQIDNPALDYSVDNMLFSMLQLLMSDNADLNAVYMQKISQLYSFELVKDTGKNENVVIIGANGSGKSSFSRNIQHILGESIVIIPAQKVFHYRKENHVYINNAKLNEVYSFQQSEKLCKDTNFVESLRNDMNSLIEALIADYIQYTTEFYQNREHNNISTSDKPILEKIFHLWHKIIPHRELFYDKNMGLQVKGDNCQNYDFIYLSDGEKAVFYYAAHILLAKKDSYVIIDEPENHLNFAVVNKMWNILEQERKDCVFMYLTHNINFASSRVNTRKLWMKSYNQEAMTWDISPLLNDELLPESLYMELLGSKQNILFCEGQDNSSYDCKLYSILFPNYTIKPVDGHYNVINSVRSFNKCYEIHGNRAIGIIDKDFHEESEIKAWENDNIFSLPVCEIENIFLDEKLIVEANQRLCGTNDINCIKESLFSYVKKDIERQSVLYARDKSNYILTGSLVKVKDNIDNLTKAVLDVSSIIDPKKIYEEKKAKLQKIVDDRNYEQLIIENNSKGICAGLNKLIASNYIERVIRIISEREDLQQYLKQKYFSYIQN